VRSCEYPQLGVVEDLGMHKRSPFREPGDLQLDRLASVDGPHREGEEP
jgi:hypothetical protein